MSIILMMALLLLDSAAFDSAAFDSAAFDSAAFDSAPSDSAPSDSGSLGSSGQPSQAAVQVRVGIVAYEDFHHELGQFDQLFYELARQDPTFRFQLAVGSYAEVLHWIDEQLVDVAVLTPGVFAGLLSSEENQPRGCTYLATVELPAARSTWASPARRMESYSDNYRSVCLVSDKSSINSVEDLRRLAAEQRVEFLFVHPLSVSGHVVPREALRSAGIQVDPGSMRFTYSHSQSIRLLADRTDRRERVAFVWDDASGHDRSLETGVHMLPFPQLDELVIPHDVIVARRGLEQVDRLAQLLVGDVSGEQSLRFTHNEDWRVRFGQVRDWLAAGGTDALETDGQRISLEEIGNLLLQSSRSQPQPPRLALVLSGGGARCSWQVGAVRALEEKLAQLRRANPDHPIDIDLVVGTSGGAINSLPVAMGVTRTAAGVDSFRATWCELNQVEIVRPPLSIRINMGLWFALLQTTLVVWIVKWRVSDPNRQGWTFAATYTALAGVEVLIGYLPFTPWGLLGTNHILHHIWLWLSFGVRASAWSLFLIGLGALALQTIRARRGDHIRLPRRLTKTVLVASLLGLPLLQLVTILGLEETLSSGQGMESALADKFPVLINRHLVRQEKLPLEIDTKADVTSRLQSASRQVIERSLLTRDLVITGSCLRQSSQDLPSDLYFYAPADPSMQFAPYGERGISLRDQPQILLDVIMGSGSIFPVFPARSIEGIPREGERIDLVDGGFAHNSPVEAAVLWGATHVVLLDVTPRNRPQGGNFVKNLTSSVRHLHRQAQLLDARSRGKVIIFTLSPEPPHLCILDFANNLVAASVQRGYDDAMKGTADLPGFHREMGEPVFVDVTASR